MDAPFVVVVDMVLLVVVVVIILFCGNSGVNVPSGITGRSICWMEGSDNAVRLPCL